MKIEGLYVITDKEIFPGRTHIEEAQAAIAGGAKIIQLRDKSAKDIDFYNTALELRRLTRDAGAIFIVNDRVHIALAADADGVNIGQTDLPISIVRRLLGANKIIGVSAHTLEQAIAAERNGADYIGFGPIYTTMTKLDAASPQGLDTLRTICERLTIPVVAIGGISLGNIENIRCAKSAAVISAVVCAPDMKYATEQLIKKFEVH